MSDAASEARDSRRGWARPKSGHDRIVRGANIILPAGIGALVAILVVAPLASRRGVSFVLDKNKVDRAQERMKASNASYRGVDDDGRPFALEAGSAVQNSSKVPVVVLKDLSARMTLDDGAGVIRAPNARYDLDARRVRVDGPMTYQSQGGYRLETHDVLADLPTKTLSSDRPLSGRMPLGSFTAQGMQADLDRRTVTLTGRARLHIVQGAATRR